MKRFDDADRIYKNQSDGMTFYGYDDHETGETFWYDKKGNLDSVTRGGGTKIDKEDKSPRRRSRRT